MGRDGLVYMMMTKMAASRSRALRLTNDSGQKGQRKSVRKVMQRNNERTDEGIGGRVDEWIEVRIDERIEGRIDERIEGRIGERIEGRSGEGVEGRVGERFEGERVEEVIRCLCACREEKGEMVCCDVCEGWSHLSCLGMKEGVGVMEGKEIVCHFCMSACLLALQKEVAELREELWSARVELKEVKEQNSRLKCEIEHEKCERLSATQEKVVGSMTRCGMVAGDRSKGEMRLGEGEKQVDRQQLSSSGSEGSERQKCTEEC